MKALAAAGYDPGNLSAMTYDWRLPPFYLEVRLPSYFFQGKYSPLVQILKSSFSSCRDQYYSQLKAKIEQLYAQNNTKVVILAHSLGTKFLFFLFRLYFSKLFSLFLIRVTQYFLQWVEKNFKQGKSWIEKYVHAALMMGAPNLGSPKVC